MDLIQRLKDSFKKNSDVLLGKEFTRDLHLDLKGDNALITDFLVAPKVGIYEMDALQFFQEALIPEGLQPKWIFQPGPMSLGVFTYRQPIGRRTTKVEHTFTDVRPQYRMLPWGIAPEHKELYHLLRVVLFPDKRSIDAIERPQDTYRVDSAVLEGMQHTH